MRARGFGLGASLVMDVIDRVPKLRSAAAYVRQRMQNQIIESLNYAREHGADRPEKNWVNRIITSASHTQSYPGRFSFWIPDRSMGVLGHGDYSQEMLYRHSDAIARAILAAIDDLQPAKIGHWSLVMNARHLSLLLCSLYLSCSCPCHMLGAIPQATQSQYSSDSARRHELDWVLPQR
jgi:hypothetical protein